MRILTPQWQDGFLDYALLEGQIRIAVRYWLVLEELGAQFVVPPKSLTTILNYVRSVGPINTLRKIRSRLGEGGRNRKFYSFGLGTVIESRADRFQPGKQVTFFAPNHPELAERICVDQEFATVASSTASWPRGPHDHVGWVDLRRGPLAAEPLPHPAHSPYSGAPLCHERIMAALERIEARAAAANYFSERARWFPCSLYSHPVTSRASTPPVDGRKTAALFGLGNYAKTLILPNLASDLRVVRIHEIDPTQLGAKLDQRIAWSTHPLPADDDPPVDAYFAAGFHHTHAEIAAYALSRGKYAVVEKPLATTCDQLQTLTSLLVDPPRLFTCFNRRYGTFNDLIRQDLGVGPDDPISYYAIVYEIPLPPHHWYNWPNSRSRIVSNGCHWIDHFLFLNRYAPVRRSHAFTAPNGDVSVFVELENDAALHLVLTDKGSPRIGMREHVQLRAGRGTITLDDCRFYLAERAERIVRKRRFHRIEPYVRMYREIASRIRRSAPGDSVESLQSTSVMLELDAQLEPAGALA